ncbi:MAG: hypothetical protein ACXWMB_05735 [Candidatus Limnocylindria bacterium]
MVVVGVEAILRLRQGSAAGTTAARLEGIALVVVAVTAAGGLGLLVGGARPRELLHFVYGFVAIAALPLTTTLSAGWAPRRRAVAALLGALVALVAILRLFATG